MMDTSEIADLDVRPAADIAASGWAGLHRTQPGAQPARALRVLVVDDVADVRDVAAAFIRSAGHDVACVPSGADAVREAADNDYDVVMMDLMMPQMTGLAATKRIRALPSPRCRVPIVAMSMRSRSADVETCLWNGMDGHLAKPFSPYDLLQAVERGDAVGQAMQRDRMPGGLRAMSSDTPP